MSKVQTGRAIAHPVSKALPSGLSDSLNRDNMPTDINISTVPVQDLQGGVKVTSESIQRPPHPAGSDLGKDKMSSGISSRHVLPYGQQGQAKFVVESTAKLPDPVLTDLAVIGAGLISATQYRIACENSLRNMVRDGTYAPVVAIAEARVLEAAEVEKDTLKTVTSMAKAIPYVKAMGEQSGVGVKSAAKLIAMAGDPLWHEGEQRARTQGEWRAVCGMTPTSGRGPWSNTTRPILWNLAGCAVRVRIEPYRTIYDAYKEMNQGATHPGECARCGVLVCARGCDEPHKGHARKKIPARAGDPLSKGHLDARARRVLMSEFTDLFYTVRKNGIYSAGS